MLAGYWPTICSTALRWPNKKNNCPWIQPQDTYWKSVEWLPGIQALFGFQLIAVFNQGFSEKLSTVQQQLHFVSIILTICAVALVMTPAALHRQIDPLAVTRRFIKSSTTLLLLSMVPLGLSISLEVYIIAQIITGLFWLSFLAAGGVLLLFFSLWVLLPNIERRGRRSIWRHPGIAKKAQESR